ncbi:glutathione-dependent disulfide-bond oxidoreductase [Novosphingobium sp. YJ-S2-02]|uniref:Glutathione-dependent disulfide-bond oxidoreductase n=1 Tax=Novosphingobium aureum TaxID=2792964 RepID=A0A931MK72_9SPHN|nr:glutathione-dependent disulfide-bond oxidoreductase [Novosphingobium aureum]MBH0112597.1 glutathione-dependent disulfide-bond oxidoreductase [Novosphingobium aureum]
MADAPYSPPKVWTWDRENGGEWASINRPIAGPTHEARLPRGDHPMQLWSLGTPNGQKVTIMLEELLAAGVSGAEYDAWYIDIGKGDQFSSGFVEVNPNSKIPALLDCSGPKPVRVFESGAILMYLAEKFGMFLPEEPAARAECVSWLMWQMSTAPIIGGGFGHFYAYAPEKFEYPINRFAMETKRIFDVADRRLADMPYLAGETYSIADIAAYGWLGGFVRGESYTDAATFLDVPSYKNLMRWGEELGAREAVRRGRIVNRRGEGMVEERHSAADIDAVLGA